ncbi:MAG: hypothetical protein ACRD82_01030, partial [Blastocatellia bacterium]
FMLCSAQAMAQNTPKVELFGGYSYTRSSFFQDELDKVNGNGWHGSVSVSSPFWVEGVVDVSGHYGSAQGVNSSLHLFLAGPRFVYHGKRFCFFSQTLFGRARVRADAAVPGVTTAAATDSAFAVASGGGFDIRVKDKLSLRVAQLDYVSTNFNGYAVGAFRFSTGVVLHFGKR